MCYSILFIVHTHIYYYALYFFVFMKLIKMFKGCLMKYDQLCNNCTHIIPVNDIAMIRLTLMEWNLELWLMEK